MQLIMAVVSDNQTFNGQWRWNERNKWRSVDPVTLDDPITPPIALSEPPNILGPCPGDTLSDKDALDIMHVGLSRWINTSCNGDEIAHITTNWAQDPNPQVDPANQAAEQEAIARGLAPSAAGTGHSEQLFLGTVDRGFEHSEQQIALMSPQRSHTRQNTNREAIRFRADHQSQFVGSSHSSHSSHSGSTSRPQTQVDMSTVRTFDVDNDGFTVMAGKGSLCTDTAAEVDMLHVIPDEKIVPMDDEIAITVEQLPNGFHNFQCPTLKRIGIKRRDGAININIRPMPYKPLSKYKPIFDGFVKDANGLTPNKNSEPKSQVEPLRPKKIPRRYPVECRLLSQTRRQLEDEFKDE